MRMLIVMIGAWLMLIPFLVGRRRLTLLPGAAAIFLLAIPAGVLSLAAFIERLPFSYLHVFSYSKRPGTRAADLPNHVPAPEVKKRARELRALSEKKAREFRRSQTGRMLRVLTLRSQLEETTPALSSNYLQVRVPGRFASNEWLDVAMKDIDGPVAETALLASVNS